MDIIKLVLSLDAFVILGNVAVVLAVDFLLGVLLSIRRHEFDWDRLPDTLADNVLPYLGGLAVLAFAAKSVSIEPIFLGAVAVYLPKLLLDVKDKVLALFGPAAPPHG